MVGASSDRRLRAGAARRARRSGRPGTDRPGVRRFAVGPSMPASRASAGRPAGPRAPGTRGTRGSSGSTGAIASRRPQPPGPPPPQRRVARSAAKISPMNRKKNRIPKNGKNAERDASSRRDRRRCPFRPASASGRPPGPRLYAAPPTNSSRIDEERTPRKPNRLAMLELLSDAISGNRDGIVGVRTCEGPVNAARTRGGGCRGTRALP